MPSSVVLSTLLLHTTDRHGHPRKTPLAAAPAGQNRFLIMGTNFGRPRHLAWSQGLLRHPTATVAWHDHSFPVRARRRTPEELHAARPGIRILAAMPVLDVYAAASDRDIRVFLITPAHDLRLPSVTSARPRR
jgi:deazaflavin-dependent oxidoreductase (nitroreductase family)